MISLFLFAHQDDECAVFQKIVDEIDSGNKVRCFFMTTGKSIKKSKVRNEESLRVLGDLDVPIEDVLFVGNELNIIDGDLINRCADLAVWLESYLINCTHINSIYIPAWEGGHPDHDALHAVVVMVCSKLKIENICWQFPLYNARKCIKPFFKVLSPLNENGPVIETAIPYVNRVSFLYSCLKYPSQRITWLGLFFPFMLHYLFKGHQSLQEVSASRLAFRPHEGPLYYEMRGFTTYKKVSTTLFREMNSYMIHNEPHMSL